MFLLCETILSIIASVFVDGNGCMFGWSEARSLAVAAGLLAVGLSAAIILLIGDTPFWKVFAVAVMLVQLALLLPI
jgi:hypothetical protein